MPWDFETQVSVDADEILDYVRDNKDWFLDQLGCSESTVGNTLLELERHVTNLINEYDDIRRFRDESSNNRDDRAVKLYEELTTLRNRIRSMMAR
jgi:hypothetical protein